ncbi:WGR domain-containing protein [Jhaorihella thermophila]|uniref:WGR domain-containing protein, predicted DNA-binding domain in MolR n=1 Tax=Jhaorihella thermophila TaxID=488547 RepID=A0A1H5UPP6_9RHOB|nr:WGR domain-containing protein [Jhaorihella thermophila]SEF77000.1 WGR domain-containing protein, predicted DNA-binding domain in MolR [Jhaorihella thermophila]
MIWLERHDAGANMHRFYAIEITRDLFGTWLLVRRWGRIGRGGGQSLVESYPDRAQAEQARRKLAATKLRRGYA